jgi:hypothetical protein
VARELIDGKVLSKGVIGVWISGRWVGEQVGLEGTALWTGNLRLSWSSCFSDTDCMLE